MEISRLARRLPIFPLFIAVSLLVGWLIPGFYAWTDSDQSRPSPLLWKVPLGSAIASVAFCLALPWLPIARRAPSETIPPPVRFSLRSLLMLTAVVAVAIPLLIKIPLVVSGLVYTGSFVSFVTFCVRNSQHRMAASALFACMILPYSWLIGYDELDRILPTLAVIIAGMPALAPAALVGQLFEQHFCALQWLAFLLTAFELMAGIWMIRLGRKPTIAYLLLVMQISALGSLAFYMMCIA